MWQRIQILYLAIAAALVGSLFFCNMATIIGPEGAEVTIGYHEKLPFLLLTIMAFTAHVGALASTRIRFLQMRVCVIAALILTGFQVWLAVDVISHRNEMVFSFTAAFPLVAAILDVMAAKNIMLDEMMVQAHSRIRKKKIFTEISKKNGGLNKKFGPAFFCYETKSGEPDADHQALSTNANERLPLQHSLPATDTEASQKNSMPLRAVSFAVISQRSPGRITFLKRTLSIPLYRVVLP